MPDYLVEIRMNGAGARERERAARTLDAARARLRRTGGVTPTLTSRLSVQDGRLICALHAPSLEAVRRLLSTALLPPATVREIAELTIDPGADPQVA